MDTEKLIQELYDKMAAEQERFKHELLGMSVEEVLDHAYEYAMRQDILMEMEPMDLAAPLAAALLESPSPLADVYKDFQDMETRHMENIRDCIEDRAGYLLNVQREVTRSIPLYRQTGEYAREHGELGAFRASRQANVACKEAIEAVIQAGYDGMHLTADPKDILAEFGPERVTYVLAVTIQSKNWDGRFSRDNKAWAAAVPMFEQDHRLYAYIAHVHSTVLDGFVSMVRRELDATPEKSEQKPSIKAQLSGKPSPGNEPAAQRHQKDREAR